MSVLRPSNVAENDFEKVYNNETVKPAKDLKKMPRIIDKCFLKYSQKGNFDKESCDARKVCESIRSN